MNNNKSRNLQCTNEWKKVRNFILLSGMVLILVGNSGIGAHDLSVLGYLIRLRHLIRSRAVKNLILFFFKRDMIFFKCAQYIF